MSNAVLSRLVFLILAACSLNVVAGPVWKKGTAIPVVVEGSACNATSDKVGISSGNAVLSCQSGTWSKASAGIKNIAQFAINNAHYGWTTGTLGFHTYCSWTDDYLNFNSGGGYLYRGMNFGAPDANGKREWTWWVSTDAGFGNGVATCMDFQVCQSTRRGAKAGPVV